MALWARGRAGDGGVGCGGESEEEGKEGEIGVHRGGFSETGNAMVKEIWVEVVSRYVWL